MFFYRLFVLLLFAIERSIALKCYSCGDENIFLGQEYPSPSPCDEMERSENLDMFTIECPQEFLGCITQFKGKEITRTCDTLAIDDCKTANGITYCYCSQDLCNGKQSRIDAHKAYRDVLINYPSDDEDYSEMSGLGQPDDDDDLEDDEKYESSSSQTSANSWIILVLGLNFLLLKTLLVIH